MASQLNILSQDIEHINGDFLNVPFMEWLYGRVGAEDMQPVKWMMRHRYRYLHYYLSVQTLALNAPLILNINFGTGVEYEPVSIGDGDNLEAGDVIAGYVDLENVTLFPSGIPYNAWMQIWWQSVSNGRAVASWIIESSSATL